MGNKPTTQQRIAALTKHLDIGPDEYPIGEDTISQYDGALFQIGRQEYLVLTDSEANERAREYIENSAWAFNASFIADHTALGLNGNAQAALTKMQGELCEDANDLVLGLIADFNKFVRDAIAADGRAHFMNTYDDEEHEVRIDNQTYYVYRVQ